MRGSTGESSAVSLWSRLVGRGQEAVELGRVLLALPAVEVGRRRSGPKPLLERVRRRGRRSRRRDAVARVRLQGVIAWLDARLPGPANCYRRALLEIALDRGAAAEPLRMGLKAYGGVRSGHAWLSDGNAAPADYDVEVAL